MSIFDAAKVVLFSEMKGQLLDGGKPLAKRKIKRIVDLNKEKSDETVTDAEGRFSFPEWSTHSAAQMLPSEFAARQELWLIEEGKEDTLLWAGVKRKPEANVESKGEILDATCNIKNTKRWMHVMGSSYFTVCEWDVEEDEKPRVPD